MTPPEAELIAAAKAYVQRQDAPFSAESWRAWDRLKEAVRVVDNAPPDAIEQWLDDAGQIGIDPL